MIKKVLYLLFISISLSSNIFASAPSRANSYVSGTVIDPVAVTGNEVPLYTYLQSGVDTYKAGSITQAAVSSTAGILYSQLNLSGGIIPTDFNTTTTTSIYQLANISIPTNGTFNIGPATNQSILYYKNGGSGYLPTLMGYGGPTYPYIKVSETETSGTNGGTATSGSWITRVLNTTDNDTSAISSLGSNQITLPAGTYKVSVKAPFLSCNGYQIRLQNITDSTTLLLGVNGFAGSALSMSGLGVIEGIITLSGTKALAVQYQVGTTANTSGLGAANSFGTEVYTIAEFTKIS